MDRNNHTVGLAGGILGRMAPDAKGAVPELVGMRKAPGETQRRAAASF